MNLNTILTNYVSSGYSGANAMAKTCQDIILRQISKSDLNKNITIKGGVAMMVISKDKRRATQDIDLDFIRYSLEDSAIVEFIKKLNDDEVKIKIVHPIQKLHHHDYDGKRVIIDISDNHGNTFSTKLDIGIHKDTNIEQDELCFDLNVDSETVLLFANSMEQICVEKIKSLLRFGIVSTRYKDIFDIYYLVNIHSFDKIRFLTYLDKIVFKDSMVEEKTINEVKESIGDVLSNNRFKRRINMAGNNWLEMPVDDVINNIIDYLSSLELIEV